MSPLAMSSAHFARGYSLELDGRILPPPPQVLAAIIVALSLGSDMLPVPPEGWADSGIYWEEGAIYY